MAVAFDAATESVRTGTTDPHTFTHTPVGTPRGVIVTMVHGDTNTDLVGAGGITYGGVPLSSYAQGADTATEPGRAYMFFLGSGIPTGPQTVSIDLTSATTTDIQFVCITLTASGDTSAVSASFLTNDQANPSITLTPGGLTSMGFAAFYGGGASPADFTPLAGCQTVHDHDFGAFYAEVIRQSTVSSSNFTIGGTAATDDVGMAAISVTDVSNVSVTVPAAPAGATPATPDGADVTVGPSAAASTAAGSLVVVSTPSGTTVATPPALATAAPDTPEGLDKTLGITQAAAAAAGNLPTITTGTTGATVSPLAAEATAAVVAPSVNQTTTKTISPSAAPATAGVATPEGIDVTVGPTAAAASASVVAPAVSATGSGVSGTVVAPAAAAYAVQLEEEPFPWGENGAPPALGISVATTAAAATAAVVAPGASLLVGVPQATAVGSVGETRVGRPVVTPAAEATAAGNVPTEVGDAVAGADVSPPPAAATAGVTAPVVSVSINAPRAEAIAAGRPVARHGSVDVVAALASAVAVVTGQSIAIGVPSASATAACGLHVLVKTGSAHIFTTAARAFANPRRPRSIGTKDFVLLIPRPDRDTRMLIPAASTGTLVLTPLEEQTE